MSRLRATQAVDDHVQEILVKYNFRSVDPDRCTFGSCDYSTAVGTERPFAPTLVANSGEWCIQHILFPLGLRPWMLFARLEFKSGRIAGLRYSFGALDPSGFGAGAEFDGVLRLERPNEDTPELLFHSYYGDRDLQLQFTPLATEIERYSQPDFSCVWRFHLCETGFDAFPSLFHYLQELRMARGRRQRSSDPCPVRNTFERVRDNDAVWLATLNEMRGTRVNLSHLRRLKDQCDCRPEDETELGSSSAKLVREPIEKQEVLVLENGECNVISATKETMLLVNRSLREYPPIPRSERMPQLAPMPPRHVPAGLR